MITGALKSIFALSEAYPDLKANQNFLNLQEELTGTEGRIAYARQFYNDTVVRYNTKIQTFPANVIAGRARLHRARVLRGRRRRPAATCRSTSAPTRRRRLRTRPARHPTPDPACTTRSPRTSAAPSS